MMSTLRGVVVVGGGGAVRQKLDVIGRRGVGVSECSGRPIFIFLIKENWILTMTKHHAYNILLTFQFLLIFD